MDNNERAEHAEYALDQYLSSKGEAHGLPAEDYEVSDLICDLLHLGDRLGYDHQSIIDRALVHYEAETTGKECAHLPKHLYSEGGHAPNLTKD
jgi:hypothetical protein